MSKREPGKPTTAIDDVQLMMHADGELGDGEPDLDNLDAGARAKADALGELHELVRGHLELAADEVADRRFQGMWREVDKAIAAGEPRAAARADARPAGLWARITSWLDRHRGHLITGVVSAGAVATLALILRPGDRPVEVVGPQPSMDLRPVAFRSPPAIESLDTPDGTGTILNLEDEDGHTAVIWVTPADTVEGI
jgi:hypothetical protein